MLKSTPTRPHGSAETRAAGAILAASPIRLLLLPDATDAEGGPRPALLLPPASAGKPKLRVFPTIAAALAAKRSMEAAR